MRIKIGPYPNRAMANFHTDYMNKKYGYVDWPSEYTRWEKCLEKVEDFVQGFYNYTINLFLDRRVQKVKIHIDKWDTWGMDSTLAPIILPMLVQLKATKHGAPYVEMTDRPEHLQCYKEPEDHGTDKFHFQAWDWVLDEMIWAFEQKCRDDWMLDYDYNKWDGEGVKAHQKRMSNGFRLFGKYYEGLWD